MPLLTEREQTTKTCHEFSCILYLGEAFKQAFHLLNYSHFTAWILPASTLIVLFVFCLCWSLLFFFLGTVSNPLLPLSSPLIHLDDSFSVYYCNVLFVCCLPFVSGIVGFQHPGVLVHRVAWAKPAVPGMDLWRAAQLLLDGRLLQPAGLSDSHETGTHRHQATYLFTHHREGDQMVHRGRSRHTATFTHARGDTAHISPCFPL